MSQAAAALKGDLRWALSAVSSSSQPHTWGNKFDSLQTPVMNKLGGEVSESLNSGRL
jgi:hypothetical protein